MKKILALALLLFSMIPLFSVSIMGKDSIEIRDDLFYSEEELGKFGMDRKVPESYKEQYEACEIYLITGGPGSIVWENFGHSSFVVKYPGDNYIAYDYGIFSFDENFYINFALGKLYYQAWQTWADYRVQSLVDDDRTVSALKLDLDADQKYALISFLEYNTEPENSEYLYDYYYDNCATRLRDSYNAVTGGDFKAWAESVESKETLREYSVRYLSRSTFPVCFAINYLLGPIVDEDISLWEAMFLPEVLESSIAEYQGSESSIYYETEGRRDTPDSYAFNLRALILGLIFALLMQLSKAKRSWIRKASGAISSVIYLLLSIMTLALIFLMTASIHFVTYFNLNVVITMPALVLLVLHIGAIFNEKRFRKTIKKASRLFLLATLLLMALKAIFSFALIQDSLAYFIFMIMLYLGEIVEIKRVKRA